MMLRVCINKATSRVGSYFKPGPRETPQRQRTCGPRPRAKRAGPAQRCTAVSRCPPTRTPALQPCTPRRASADGTPRSTDHATTQSQRETLRDSTESAEKMDPARRVQLSLREPLCVRPRERRDILFNLALLRTRTPVLVV